MRALIETIDRRDPPVSLAPEPRTSRGALKRFLASTSFAYPILRIPRVAHHDRLDSATCEWLTQCGIVRSESQSHRLRITQTGRLAALAYGYAEEPTVQLASDLIAWSFLFDDYFAEGELRRSPAALTARVAELASVLRLEGAPSGAEPFALALDQLFGRLATHAPRDWMERFARGVRVYFEGCLRETRHRRAEETPSVATYLDMRAQSIGVHPVLDFIEVAMGAFLPSACVAHPSFARTQRLANLVSALTNDIFSARKEASEDSAYNVVSVVAVHEGLDTRAALLRSIQIHDEHLAELRAAQRELTAAIDDLSVDRYFVGVYHWLQANYEWSAEVPRYDEALPEDWEFILSS